MYTLIKGKPTMKDRTCSLVQRNAYFSSVIMVGIFLIGDHDMYDELTKQDIEKMRQELDYRRIELMPELIEEVKRTRAFGDLSENFEYKEAKRAKNRNGSRIRYLEKMIETAKIITDNSSENEVGLYDKVKVYIPEDDETQLVQIVTTVRTDPLSGLYSRESPFGKAILGKKVGDSFTVQVSADYSYEVRVMSITKGEDDGSARLMEF